MKIGACRSCAHSQNGKAASVSRNWPCQLDVIRRPLKPSDPRQRSPSEDVAGFERIERAQAPDCCRGPCHDCGVLVVDVLDDIDRGFARDRGDHLGRKWIADDPARDAGLGTNLLLQVEIRHVTIRHGGQTAIIRHRMFARRDSAQRLRDAKRIVSRARNAVGMDVDDGGHDGDGAVDGARSALFQMLSARPYASSTASFIISDNVGCGKTVWISSSSVVSRFIATT